MRYEITTEFADLIGNELLERFNSHPDSAYGLDSEYNIAYLNPGWYKFAEANGSNIFDVDAWPLGRNIFESFPKVLVPYYKNVITSALDERETSIRPTSVEYECSSPDMFRRYCMHIYPVGNDSIVMVNSLAIEELRVSDHIDGLLYFEEEDYIDNNGLLHQCSNCRRLKYLASPEQWN